MSLNKRRSSIRKPSGVPQVERSGEEPPLDMAQLDQRSTGQKTADTTNAIIDFINLNGGFAFRLNTGGVCDPKATLKAGTAKFRKAGRGAKGAADIAACIHRGFFIGQWLAIEVKSTTDTLSKDQRAWSARLIGANGVYWVVHSFDEFKTLWDRGLYNQT